ncbi:hypothetical protein LguiA_026317 [Lonicera macranthoides]
MATLKENHLFNILDAQVLKEGRKEEIRRVADLAKRCLNSSGQKRPTMREVTVELEGIRINNGASTINELNEEGEYDIIKCLGKLSRISTNLLTDLSLPLLIRTNEVMLIHPEDLSTSNRRFYFHLNHRLRQSEPSLPCESPPADSPR